MSRHAASVAWSRATPDFAYDTFDRSHTVTFASGHAVPGSSAADYKGDAARVNPEEQLVGALAACHMLTFLAIAARKRLVVDAYEDGAEGFLERNEAGRLAVTRAVLHPKVRFAPGTEVDAETLAKMHESAHANCFIAQSIKTAVTVEPA